MPAHFSLHLTAADLDRFPGVLDTTPIMPSRRGHAPFAAIDFAEGVCARLRASGWRLGGTIEDEPEVGGRRWLVCRIDDGDVLRACTHAEIYRLAGLPY